MPQLKADRLATSIPASVYGGGTVDDPASTLFIWRTASLSKATGMTVGFYVDDGRFEALWRHPEHYIDLFLRHDVAALIEPDFSLWADAPLVERTLTMWSCGPCQVVAVTPDSIRQPPTGWVKKVTQ